jgi:arsenite methyltransferase
MSNQSIIDLYTDLAKHPEKDFGWDKGMQNAINHHYKDEWLNTIPAQVWQYCAAVGNPFDACNFNLGETILDIGCGAGVDLCVASLLTGKKGEVLGVDITPAMIEKAKDNAQLAGLSNITIYESSLDKLPFENNSVDIVISNGAINLSSCKQSVFSEIHRVLKTGGQLCFSDMIKDNSYAEPECCEAESWANCVAGTLTSHELIQIIEKAGFIDVQLFSTNHYKTSPTTIGATFIATRSE